MKKKGCLVDLVKVRPMRATERQRFERLIERHHYLGGGQPVGETMRYVAEACGKWVALVTFGAAAYALADRDARLGWSLPQRQRRLSFLAQNRRFLILPGKSEPNLASHILALCTRRVAADWQKTYGHPVFALETFADPQRFQGTCYRAAGWEPLGLTAGSRRIRRDFYDQSGSPKQLFVKMLRTDAEELLCAPELPVAWQKFEHKVLARSPVKTEHSRSLWEAFAQIGEFRQARGIRHPLASVLACAACAVLAGAEGIAEMAEIVAGMEQRQLRALRCYRRRSTGRYEPPSESTLRRALSGIDAEQFDTVMAQWVSQHEDIAAVALDGKALKGCLNEEGKPLFLVSAVAHGTGAFQGQVQVDSKSNEIPAARCLLTQMGPLDDIIVTTDAAHTQVETAQVVVMEQGGDYLSPIKGNQPSLLKKAKRLLPVGHFFSDCQPSGETEWSSGNPPDPGLGRQR
jgi:hypothetical protein